LNNVKEISKKGIENLLSPKTPSIVDMLLGRGTEKVVDSETLITEVHDRVLKSLNHEFLYSTVTEESETFLRGKVLQSMDMAVLFVDLVGSTSMILNLPKEKLAIIFTTFAQEMAYVIKRHEGFVLKFMGDAVIGYFVAEDLSASVANRTVTCAESMLKILKVGINPILKSNNLPELKIKIGIDYGENTIVRYGDDLQESHVDILGPSVSMAAKIQNLAQPDQIMAGNDIYSKLHSSIQEYFVRLKLDKSE
jgi:adenylate cyclase